MAKDKQEGMDLELQRRVCFELGAALGAIMHLDREVFDSFFKGVFSKEELILIDSLAMQSDDFKYGMEIFVKLGMAEDEED